jgi:hypothetical protein
MKIIAHQYLCGCTSHIVTTPSGVKKIYWETDYNCDNHKLTVVKTVKKGGGLR